MACLLISWGVRPAAMAGHSVGEYAAAALAGVVDADDALRLVADRGLMIESLPPGAMTAVPLPADELRPLLPPGVDIAAVNAPGMCVVSGPVAAVRELEASLSARKVGTSRLRTSHAFHSPMMEPILEAFAERVAMVRLHAPEIPFVSNVTGDWITPSRPPTRRTGRGTFAPLCASRTPPGCCSRTAGTAWRRWAPGTRCPTSSPGRGGLGNAAVAARRPSP